MAESIAGCFTPLPPLIESSGLERDDLPPILPNFFVPRLQDKPQDPIIDTLHSVRDVQRYLTKPQLLPPEIFTLTGIWASEHEVPMDLWSEAAMTGPERRNHINSWDALRLSFDHSASPGPFLSEQTSRIFASARYHVDLRIHDPRIHIVHTSVENLFKSLRLVLIGTSSPLYTWNPIPETFVLTDIEDGKKGAVVIEGRDDIISESYMQRFLTIGTLLRRLELFTDVLRRRSAGLGPTRHAYTHALSSCIDHVRIALADLSNVAACSTDLVPLPSALWTKHSLFENILLALATLCDRDMHLSPSEYPDLPSTSEALLSIIYTHLESHIERGSPRTITAILFVVLSATAETLLFLTSKKVFASYENNLGLTSFNDDDKEDDASDMDDGSLEFPRFMSLEVTEALVRARDSLRLLRAAQPDHPLLYGVSSYKKITWFWADEDVEAAWHERNACDSQSTVVNEGEVPSDNAGDDDEDPPPDQDPLAQFKVFDLEPGAHLGSSSPSFSTQDSSLKAFLSAFPAALPIITPTLPDLTALVLSPLLDHCYMLSGALLTLFLSPSSHLNLHAHLTLLRSYLLLTSPQFRSRLQATLFSDEDDWKFEGSEARAMAKKSSLHRRTRPVSGNASAAHGEGGTWAVGLGLGLAERDSWPPGGSDLGFYLRTVIMDSLESHHGLAAEDDPERDDGSDGEKRTFADAEFRLGLAIRDLPAGTGRERWLNPCSIESLDFLYMDYKPPHPLDILITSDVLSKYQRIFSFILRLMRVQSASSALFRMTRKTSEPLFPTLAITNKLLLHFRFMAQSFVDTLSSYVFDTAIRGNFNAFLSQLRPGHFVSPGTSSIFGRRAAGDLLRGCMELVLDLCILAGELRRGRVEEYRAKPVLEDLFSSFREKMATLIKVLKTLVDKGSSRSHLPPEFAYMQRMASGSHMAPGGAGSLHHLLVKLDAGAWGKKAAEDRSGLHTLV
ncbi:hypothetical protein EW146_g4072 [Bondarzewia mesenterica]|uniref:Spindle pole body component n=1 Tax=Bondarzewia mesenterica TaxID=1095465 RepID=A0A4S4LW50_9AGAM|nr:hypothetical protein EW146_g4072 [Bondarzewia mesenterica]